MSLFEVVEDGVVGAVWRRWVRASLAVVVAPVASAVDATAACGDVTASESSALAAAAGDRFVVVVASQSDYTQVVARPDGRLTFESAVVRQRARRADGSWAPVDLNLRVGADRLLRPNDSWPVSRSPVAARARWCR